MAWHGISDQICKKLGVVQHASTHVQGNDSAVEFAKSLMAPAKSKLIQRENGVRFFGPLRQEIPAFGLPVGAFFQDKSQLTTSQRMMKQGQVYHGLKYDCRWNSASYLVVKSKHCESKSSRIAEIAYNTHFDITVQKLMDFISVKCFNLLRKPS